MIAAVVCWISGLPILCRVFGHKERRLTKKEIKARYELSVNSSGRFGMTPELGKRRRVCKRCEAERFTRKRKKDQQ